MTPVRILGIDPGFLRTGYGIIDLTGNHARHVCHGVIRTESGELGDRLRRIFAGIGEIIAQWRPAETAVEKVFVDRNADSALKLGQARGAAVTACANLGLAINEYSPNQIKQAIVGRGHAEKQQVQHMVRVLLCLQDLPQADAADALAVALCHGHQREGRRRLAAALAQGARQ
ncbi:MAG: crossover junction endodeoxyribonuclease RuvC [Gammaproteobacteria bacterium]|nr:crossover junction endodeoxyribonuclease RuvC [Gammaproteobacteria bacterium]